MSSFNKPVKMKWRWDSGAINWELVITSPPIPYVLGEVHDDGSWELWLFGEQDELVEDGRTSGGFRTGTLALYRAVVRNYPHLKVPNPPVMTKEGDQVARKETFELLADLEHRQWAHWVTYMLDLYEKLPYTEWLKQVKKWRGQADTPYSDLQEFEKDSDRDWAHQVLEIIADD